MENEEIMSTSQDNEIPENEVAPTTVQTGEKGFIPVKYNKEIINLDITRASELAQKGMKFETISEELELLKQLASESKKTIKQYLSDLKQQKNEALRDSLIEKCGDDVNLANEVLRLYEKKAETDDGFLEIQKNFPEIKSRKDLPESVLENAKLCGSNLFDEFLRYRFLQEKAVKDNVLSQQKGIASSAGSQLNKTRGDNPEAAEFLKGLWRK